MTEKRRQTPEQARRRRLARLQIARSDISMTQRLCETAIGMDLDKNDPVAWAFDQAIVVSYGRPFTSNRSVGALGAAWQKFADPSLAASHKDVMLLRDEAVAHAELRWRPIVLAGANTQLPSGVITVRPGIVGVRPVLKPVSYEAVRLLCADLLPRLTETFEREFLTLFPNGYNGPPLHLVEPEDGPGLQINTNR